MLSQLFSLTCIIVIMPFHRNLCKCKNYANHTLFRGIPVSEDHLDYYTNLTYYYDVNYWRPPGSLYKQIEFTIAPADKEAFLREADARRLYLTTILEDVQSAFDMQTVKTYIRRELDTFNWDSFYRVDDIYEWLRDMNKMYPREIELQSIGKTYENRDILAVRLVLKGSKMRSTVILEGGVHAREWIAPAVVTYILYTLLHAPDSNNEELKTIAMTYEWYFVPVLNPDGYEYTHTKDRLWRKNRHNSGVDLNRNFGASFGTTGVSNNPRDETYCGMKEFSEKESAAMADFVRSKRANLEYYFAFHSYGQFMILPYAYTKSHMENFDEVKKMAAQAARRIARKHGTHYITGTAYDTVGYTTSGVSGCWVKKTFRVPFVVTFELRDTGRYGFALPPSLILPTCQETMDGIISLLTPRSEHVKKLSETLAFSGQTRTIFDIAVLFCNVIFFFLYVLIEYCELSVNILF